MADRSSLSRATEPTDAPTPGYLYVDIANSVASNSAACVDTVTYLTRRLNSKKNHNVKYKCLKVIQMVAQNSVSRNTFKRTVCQNMDAIATIKECLNFRGPPDPVRGDEIYSRVRAQAKETLDAVYSDAPSSEQPMSGGGGMGGYGNSGFGSGGGGGMMGTGGGGNVGSNRGGPRKMEGIGNPMFKDPRLEPDTSISKMSIGEVVSAAKEGFVGIIKDPLAKNVGVQQDRSMPKPAGMPGYGSSSGSWNNAPPGASQLAQSTGGQWTMASNRGPNAVGGGGNDSYYKSRDASASGGSFNWAQNQTSGTSTGSGVGGSWASSSKPSVASQSRASALGPTPTRNSVTGAISGSGGSAASDGTYERNLIMELCPPGGMRAEPPAEKLQSFAKAIPSLNPDLVCPALLDALEDGQPWIIRAKALCVMEVTINVSEENKGDGNNPYADFFHACREEIEPLVTHSRSAVREPAKKVMKALGLELTEQQQTPAVSKMVEKPASPPNLLDFGEDTTAARPPSIPNVPPPTEAPPMPPPDMPAPAPPSTMQGGGGGSLFGGMNMKGKPKVPAESSDAPPSQTKVASDADLLGVIENPSQEAVLEPSTTPGLFGDVTIKQATSDVGSESTANGVGKENVGQAVKAIGEVSIGSGSAFSFINGGNDAGSAVAAAENPKPSAVPTPAAKQSFDPLLSLGTTGNNAEQQLPKQPTMAMTPQMAVAYQQQQQMLMMQMQMQQMQMAGGQAHFNMMQQAQQKQHAGSLASISTPINIMPRQNPVMGGSNGSGVATSFAFMDDPAKTQKEASNKKFDFIQDAMKSAK